MFATNLTEVLFEANLLCFHDLDSEDDRGEVCLFEGEVDYTITLNNGQPWGPAEVECPECGNTCLDDGVVESYLDSLE